MSDSIEAQLRLPEIQAPAFNILTNIQDLRISQEYSDAEIQPILVSIPIGKPNKTTFFQVRPELEFTFDCLLLELKDTNETYFITPTAEQLIPGLARPVRLYLAVDTRGNPRLIPVPLTAGTHPNAWHASLQKCIDLAKGKWIRIQADMTAGSYSACTTPTLTVSPRWPTERFEELISIAVSGKIISDKNHPVISQLAGEVVN